MQKKTIDRDDWGKANGYKVFRTNTCAQCMNFSGKPNSPSQGYCSLMSDAGVNCDVVVTAVCDRFRFQRKQGGNNE